MEGIEGYPDQGFVQFPDAQNPNANPPIVVPPPGPVVNPPAQGAVAPPGQNAAPVVHHPVIGQGGAPVRGPVGGAAVPPGAQPAFPPARLRRQQRPQVPNANPRRPRGNNPPPAVPAVVGPVVAAPAANPPPPARAAAGGRAPRANDDTYPDGQFYVFQPLGPTPTIKFVKGKGNSFIDKSGHWQRIPDIRRFDNIRNAVFLDEEDRPSTAFMANLKATSARPIEFDFAIPEDDLKLVRDAFPDMTVITGTASHSHPLLAATRYLGEEMLFERLRHMRAPQIVDIGGNVGRHIRRRRRIHSLNPNILPDDAARNIEFQRMVNGERNCPVSMCAHRFETACNCVQNGAVFLSVHSLYYLNPTDILTTMLAKRSPTMIALHHTFEDAFGHIGDSGVYTRRGNQVIMAVAGNTHLYRHDALDWLKTGAHFVNDANGGSTLVWRSEPVPGLPVHVTTFSVLPGNHMVTTLVLEQPDSIRAMLDLPPCRVVLSPNKSGNYYRPMLATVNNATTLDYYKMSWYDWMMGWFDQQVNPDIVVSVSDHMIKLELGTGVVTISKQLLHSLTAKFQGVQKMDNQIMAAIFAYAKDRVKDYNLPGDLSSEMIIPTVRIAIVVIMERGLTFYRQMNAMRDTFADYNSLAASFATGSPVRASQLNFMLLIAILTSIGLMLARYLAKRFASWVLLRFTRRRPRQLAPFQHQLGAISLMSINGEGPSRWLLRMLTPVFNALGRLANRVIDLRTVYWLYSLTMKESFDFNPQPAYCCRKMEPPPVGKDFNGQPYHKVRADVSHPCKVQFGCVPVVSVKNRSCVVPASCIHNLHYGARVRLLHKPRLNPMSWAIREPTAHRYQILKREKSPKTPLIEWLARFPLARRAMLEEAQKRRILGLTDDLTFCDWEIKREKYVKGGNKPLTVSDDWYLNMVKPRIISSPPLQFLLRFGPSFHEFGNFLAQNWNGKRCNIIYTKGYTAEKLGKSIAWAIQQLGGDAHVVAKSYDASNFDGSVQEPHFDFRLKVYKLANVKGATAAMTIQKGYKWVQVKDEFGNWLLVVFKAVMDSGKPDTSCGNSITNAEMASEVYKEVFDVSYDYVLGDDNSLLVNKEDAKLLPPDEELVERGKTLGFDLEIQTEDAWNLSFCSGYFYRTDSGIVWGPKIGRVLAKTFWCDKSFYIPGFDPRVYTLEWARAVAIGLLRDVQFVPVLRKLIPRIIDLSTLKPPPPIVDMYKMHALELHEATDETFQQVARIYSVDVGDIHLLEVYIQSAPLFEPFDHPVLTKILDVDVPLKKEHAPKNDFYDEQGQTFIYPLLRSLPKWSAASMFASIPMSFGDWWLSNGVESVGGIRRAVSMYANWLFECHFIKMITQDCRFLFGNVWRRVRSMFMSLTVDEAWQQLQQTPEATAVIVDDISKKAEEHFVKQFNTKQTAQFWKIFNALTAPVWEEGVKSLGGWVLSKCGVNDKKRARRIAAFLFSLGEFGLYSVTWTAAGVPFWTTCSLRILPLIMHNVNSGSHKDGMLTHFIYNSTMLLMHLFGELPVV